MATFQDLVALYQPVWPIAVDSEHGILSVRYRSGDDEWVFVGTVDEETQILTLFSRAPEPCPEDRRAAMALFIVRANFGMSHGNFDMDLSDGEIRFRTGADLAGGEITPSLVQSLTNYNLATMATFLPGLRAVIGGADPLEAFDALGLEGP